MRNEHLIKDIRRNCLMCSTYRSLKPGGPQQKTALAGVERLYNYWNDKYNRLRREDAELGRINSAFENKRLCLDCISHCKECDKELDYLNRNLRFQMEEEDK